MKPISVFGHFTFWAIFGVLSHFSRDLDDKRLPRCPQTWGGAKETMKCHYITLLDVDIDDEKDLT